MLSPLPMSKEITMHASDLADQIIQDVTGEYPYLRGNSIIVMALIHACNKVLDLRAQVEGAQSPGERREGRWVADTHPAFQKPRSADVATLPVAPGAMRCPNCDTYETNYDEVIRLFRCLDCGYEEVR